MQFDMFPVKRNESDDESFKWAVGLLQKGRVVFIAVAGLREVLPPGAKFPRFVKVTANVGKGIRFKKVNANLKNRDKLQEQATQAMKAIYQLKDNLLAKYN